MQLILITYDKRLTFTGDELALENEAKEIFAYLQQMQQSAQQAQQEQLPPEQSEQ